MSLWQEPPKRKIRVSKEEQMNRDGHWAREFSCRGDAWPVIEHWAVENGYHLIAMKSGKRVYHKGENTGFYQTFVEVRQDETRVKLASWIQAGVWARALHAFFLRREMPPSPSGWKAVRTRRAACEELNGLLFRLRQPLIAGSGHFHIADLDLSLLALAALMSVPVVGLVVPLVLRMDIKPGLANGMLAELGKRLATLLIVGAGLLVAQWYGTKRFEKIGSRFAAAGLSLVAFSVLSVVLFTKTTTEFRESRLSYYCLHHFDAATCREIVDKLPASERDKLKERLRQWAGEIATRP